MSLHRLLEPRRGMGADETRLGRVWLVGAGPGDVELITVRALKLLRLADVVIYDRLIAPELLEYCRPDALKIHVGKRRSLHSVSQEGINALLIEHARQGRDVVRLKGGDPFVFGRGGEEMMALRAQGISVTVVPGVTAASACAAAVGIPLTHRDFAAGVSLLTAQRGKDAPAPDWSALAADRQRTLVFYMGLSEVATIRAELMRHGMPGQTPVAVVANGATARQQALRCALDELETAVLGQGLESPSLIIVGDVVQLADPALLEHLPEGSDPVRGLTPA